MIGEWKLTRTSIKIAFFKGGHNSYLHRFIKWYTKSPYSHAELILPDGKTWVSISPFMGSIVERRIDENPDPEEWDYIEFDLHWREPVKRYQLEQLERFIQATEGSRYDWIGMLLSQVCPFIIKHKKKWYCSEWIAYALVHSRVVMWDQAEMYKTPDLHPGKLFRILSDIDVDSMYK
jgi:hypothetical protein